MSIADKGIDWKDTTSTIHLKGVDIVARALQIKTKDKREGENESHCRCEAPCSLGKATVQMPVLHSHLLSHSASFLRTAIKSF